MTTKASEYIERYRQLDRIGELLEQLRQSDAAGRADQTTGTQNVIEKDPARGFDGPAHRKPVDLPRAYRESLERAYATDARSFGQNVDTGKTIPKVFESPGDNLPSHHQSSGGVQTRQPGSQRRRRPATSTAKTGVPGYVAHGMPGSHMEVAVNLLEEFRRQALSQPTRGTATQAAAPDQSPAVPAEQQCFDATELQLASGQMPEMTNPSFAYVPGKSGYDEWLALYAGGEVQSGEGKEVPNDAYGVTVTQCAPKKTT